MVPAIFKDTASQALFDKQGFIVVDFLDSTDIQKLDTLFDELHPALPDAAGFVSGSYSNDLEYKRKASDAIVQIFRRHYERLFVGYQPFGAAFLYKLPSQNSELGVHQDWTIVNEARYVALNCWVPLTDIDAQNGALHVLPGSQYPEYPTLRAPTLPFFFSGSEDEVISQTIPLYVKAGQAVILNQSVIHYSPPNRSDKIRKAITAGIKTEGAPMIFHYRTGDNKVERYAMPEDFLLRFENFATSIFEQPVIGELESVSVYQEPVLKKENVRKKIVQLKNNAGFKKARASFFTRLFARG